MKHEIERRDLKIRGTLPRVRLIAETPSEAKMLSDLEQELNSEFGSRYVLQFASIGDDPRYGGFTLEYYVKSQKE